MHENTQIYKWKYENIKIKKYEKKQQKFKNICIEKYKCVKYKTVCK